MTIGTLPGIDATLQGYQAIPTTMTFGVLECRRLLEDMIFDPGWVTSSFIVKHLNILKPYYRLHSGASAALALLQSLCIYGDTAGGLRRWLHNTMLD